MSDPHDSIPLKQQESGVYVASSWERPLRKRAVDTNDFVRIEYHSDTTATNLDRIVMRVDLASITDHASLQSIISRVKDFADMSNGQLKVEVQVFNDSEAANKFASLKVLNNPIDLRFDMRKGLR